MLFPVLDPLTKVNLDTGQSTNTQPTSGVSNYARRSTLIGNN